MMNKFAIVDVETTGLVPGFHEVIEFGCVLAEEDGDGVLGILEEIDIKIKPDNILTADPVALEINGYSESKWADALPRNEALSFISEKMKYMVPNPNYAGQMINLITVIGHNVHYDLAMLFSDFSKSGIKHMVNKFTYDTNYMARIYLRNSGLKSYSLRSLAEKFEIINENPHSALSDAKTTYLVYKRLKELEKNIVLPNG